MTSSYHSQTKKPWRAKSGICGQTSAWIRSRPIDSSRAKYRNAHAVLCVSGFRVWLLQISEFGQSQPDSAIRDFLNGN
ncbi:MAG: hypothetical protein P8N76_04035, partial [Pirellulaceae bacterium]|nr:hypothetical protein [Pirellulaceae bacterium]